jgi:plastocyanin
MKLEVNGQKMTVKSNTLSLSAFFLLASISFVNADVIEVNIEKMRFLPANITISAGDTVRWVNREKRQYHSVWFDALGGPEGEYFFPAESVEKTFEKSGEFPYRCGPHPEMQGLVRVQNPLESTHHTVNYERQAELTYLVKQDCGSCHGMLLKGGLGPALLTENLKKQSTEDLTAVILYGRPGTPMPPWNGILSDQDAIWISQQLKAGAFVNEQ